MTVSTYIFFVLVKGNKHRNQTSWKTWPNTLQAQTSRQPPHLLLVSKDSGNSGSEWPQKNTAVCRFSQTTRHHVFQTKKRRPFWPSVSKQYEKHINIKLTALQHSVRTFQADSHGRLKGPALSQNIQRYIHMQDNNQEHTFTWIKWHSSFSTGVVAWVYTNLSLSSSCTASRKKTPDLPSRLLCLLQTNPSFSQNLEQIGWLHGLR